MARFYDLNSGFPAGNTQQQAADYAASVLETRRDRAAVVLLDTWPQFVNNLTTYRRAGTAGYNGTEGTQGRALAWCDFFAGYIECAEWADGPRDENGDDLEDAAPVSGDELRRMAEDAGDWYARNFADLSAAADMPGYSWARAGHDFWLTRNGHGAGYWDRDELLSGDGDETLRRRLTDAAEKAGGAYLYQGDDGATYCETDKRRPTFDSLADVRAAVDAGRRVCWKTPGYEVTGGDGQYLVTFISNGNCAGLIESEYNAADFFIVGGAV